MTSPRYRTTKWDGHDNHECAVELQNGKTCPFKTLDRGLMVRHVRERHPTKAEDPERAAVVENPLAGINFASDDAAELAAKLDAGEVRTLRGMTHTGKTGYTVADVRAARNHEEDV